MRHLTEELAARGHRMLVLAPSRSPELVRESRRLLREAAREEPERLFAPDGEVRVLGVGELLPIGPRRRSVVPSPAGRHRAHDRGGAPARPRRRPARPRAVRPVGQLGGAAPLARAQRRHVPRADRAGALDPGRAALRRALLRPARRADRVVLGHAATSCGGCSRPTTGSSGPARPCASARRASRARPCGWRSSTRRSARRCGCSCARCGACRSRWTGRRACSRPSGAAPVGALRSRLRERVSVVSAAEGSAEEVLANADVLVAASHGQASAPGLLVRAIGAGAVPVAARLETYEEVIDEHRCGLLFEPGDVLTLAAQLERLIAAPERLDALREPGAGGPAGARLVERRRRVRGDLRRHPRAPPRPRRARQRSAGALAARPADRRRPAHAHRPLARLRHHRSRRCWPPPAPRGSGRSR